MAGMLRRSRRSAQRDLAAVPALVLHVEPRNSVGDGTVSGARRAQRLTLRKPRLGTVPAPGTFARPISPEAGPDRFRSTREKVEVTLQPAAARHR